MGLVKVAAKKDLVFVNLKGVEVNGKGICLVNLNTYYAIARAFLFVTIWNALGVCFFG